jgi:hypothetical protein
MASPAELQSRVDALEVLLRERDRKDAEERAAALAARRATDDAKDAEASAAAAATEREQIRRGSWLNHLLGEQPPDAALDFAALEKQIPAAGWPAGTDPSNFAITGGVVSVEDVAQTTLGKALASLTKHI